MPEEAEALDAPVAPPPLLPDEGKGDVGQGPTLAPTSEKHNSTSLIVQNDNSYDVH